MCLCQQTQLFIFPWFISTDYSQVCSFLLVSLFTALTAFFKRRLLISWFLLRYCVGTPSVRSTASLHHWPCPSQQDQFRPQTEERSWIPHFHTHWVWEPSPTPARQGRMPFPSGFVHKPQGAQENRREESVLFVTQFSLAEQFYLKSKKKIVTGKYEKKIKKAFEILLDSFRGGQNAFNKENSYNYSLNCGVESISGDHLATQNPWRETHLKRISFLPFQQVELRRNGKAQGRNVLFPPVLTPEFNAPATESLTKSATWKQPVPSNTNRAGDRWENQPEKCLSSKHNPQASLQCRTRVSKPCSARQPVLLPWEAFSSFIPAFLFSSERQAGLCRLCPRCLTGCPSPGFTAGNKATPTTKLLPHSPTTSCGCCQEGTKALLTFTSVLPSPSLGTDVFAAVSKWVSPAEPHHANWGCPQVTAATYWPR